jgi:tRNA U34 5-carboxymethylaminomethyl modifying enzyme MnmG/GidA
MKLNKPLGSAAPLDIDLVEENFGVEPVDAVVTVEQDIRATASADDLTPYEIETNAHSAQRDFDAWVVTRTVPETTVLLVDNLPRSTVKTPPIHMSPPRFCPPLSRVFEPDKLTNCDKSRPCVFLEACHLDILTSKK